MIDGNEYALNKHMDALDRMDYAWEAILIDAEHDFDALGQAVISLKNLAESHEDFDFSDEMRMHIIDIIDTV